MLRIPFNLEHFLVTVSVLWKSVGRKVLWEKEDDTLSSTSLDYLQGGLTWWRIFTSTALWISWVTCPTGGAGEGSVRRKGRRKATGITSPERVIWKEHMHSQPYSIYKKDGNLGEESSLVVDIFSFKINLLGYSFYIINCITTKCFFLPPAMAPCAPHSLCLLSLGICWHFLNLI